MRKVFLIRIFEGNFYVFSVILILLIADESEGWIASASISVLVLVSVDSVSFIPQPVITDIKRVRTKISVGIFTTVFRFMTTVLSTFLVFSFLCIF